MIGRPGEGETPDELTVEPVPVRGDDRATRRRLRIAVALTLVTAIVVFGALGGSRLIADRDAPDGAATQPRLAIIETGGGLATLNADGGAAVRYDAVGSVDLQFPAWSPDGSRIAAPGTAADRTASVYVFEASVEPGPGQTPPAGAITGSTGTELYTSRTSLPFYLSWSPDGRQIAFLTAEPDGLALRAVPADGSAAATIVREGEPMYWDWIDPNRLLVHAGGSLPEAFVGEVGLDGDPDAAAEVAPGLFRPPVVGRDGRFRAYVVAGERGEEDEDGENRAAIVVERLDGSARNETPIEGSVAIGFDPAGRILAYTASGGPSREPPGLATGPLRLIDAETGAERTLLDRPIIAFYWSPDGATIAALRLLGPGEPGVDIAAADSVARTDVAVREAGVGFEVAFVDVASGEIRSERDLRLSGLYAFQVIPFFDQYALSHRTWSPDGTAIALPLVDAAGRSRIMAVPVDGSDPRYVADGLIGFWRP